MGMGDVWQRSKGAVFEGGWIMVFQVHLFCSSDARNDPFWWLRSEYILNWWKKWFRTGTSHNDDDGGGGSDEDFDEDVADADAGADADDIDDDFDEDVDNIMLFMKRSVRTESKLGSFAQGSGHYHSSCALLPRYTELLKCIKLYLLFCFRLKLSTVHWTFYIVQL